MYQQVYDPVSDSLGLSSIFAVLPLIALFVLLGGVKLKAWWAGLSALVVAIVVAIAVYSMPVDQALLSASEGAAFGLFPIMWIVVTAIVDLQHDGRDGRVRRAAALVRRRSPTTSASRP